MGKRKFKIGDKVRVKDKKFKGEDAEETNEVRGKVGTVIDIDPCYCYPYTVSFEDYWAQILFRASELEKVEENE